MQSAGKCLTYFEFESMSPSLQERLECELREQHEVVVLILAKDLEQVDDGNERGEGQDHALAAQGAAEPRAQPERDAVGGRGEGHLQGGRPGRARTHVGHRQEQPRHGLREVQVGRKLQEVEIVNNEKYPCKNLQITT